MLAFFLFASGSIRDYFPLAVGNKWVYEILQIDENKEVLRMVEEIEFVSSAQWKNMLCYKVIIRPKEDLEAPVIDSIEKFLCFEEYTPKKYRLKEYMSGGETADLLICDVVLVEPFEEGVSLTFDVFLEGRKCKVHISHRFEEKYKKYKNCVVVDKDYEALEETEGEGKIEMKCVYAKGIGMVFKEWKVKEAPSYYSQLTLIDYEIKGKKR